MKTFNKCPKCGSYVLGERWCEGRKLQQFCCNDNAFDADTDCDWEGEPRIPETQKIVTTKRLTVHNFSGWDYIIYDKYGHTMIVSRSFESEEDATDDLNRELKKGLTDKIAGPYTGVLFHTPPSIKIEGQVFKKH